MTDAQRIELEALITERRTSIRLLELAIKNDDAARIASRIDELNGIAARIRVLDTPEPETKRGQWCAREYHLGDYLGVICTDDSMALYRCGHRLDRDSPLMRRAVSLPPGWKRWRWKLVRPMMNVEWLTYARSSH